MINKYVLIATCAWTTVIHAQETPIDQNSTPLDFLSRNTPVTTKMNSDNLQIRSEKEGKDFSFTPIEVNSDFDEDGIREPYPSRLPSPEGRPSFMEPLEEQNFQKNSISLKEAIKKVTSNLPKNRLELDIKESK